jgi:hypothetical protein
VNHFPLRVPVKRCKDRLSLNLAPAFGLPQYKPCTRWTRMGVARQDPSFYSILRPDGRSGLAATSIDQFGYLSGVNLQGFER